MNMLCHLETKVARAMGFVAEQDDDVSSAWCRSHQASAMNPASKSATQLYPAKPNSVIKFYTPGPQIPTRGAPPARCRLATLPLLNGTRVYSSAVPENSQRRSQGRLVIKGHGRTPWGEKKGQKPSVYCERRVKPRLSCRCITDG